MSLTTRLAERFREVILDGKFIAYTNVKEQLKDVDLKMASSQIADLNTIAKLTFHLNYYIAGVLKVFEGGDLEIRDKYSFDMPDLYNNSQWEKMKSTLFANAEKFSAAVQALPDERLSEAFVDKKYGDYLKNIEAMIEHCYYHFGQIVILKKIIKSQAT